MFVVTYCEHVPALEGVGKDGEMGPRTGKVSGEILFLFDNQKSAEQWCKQCQKKWCKASKKDPGVLTWWYEIWDYPVLQNAADDYKDAGFVTAYNKFGHKMDLTWTPQVETVLNTETRKKLKKQKRRKK